MSFDSGIGYPLCLHLDHRLCLLKVGSDPQHTNLLPSGLLKIQKKFLWQLSHFQVNGCLECSDKYKLHSQFITATFLCGLMARKMHQRTTIPSGKATAVLNNLPISIMDTV